MSPEEGVLYSPEQVCENGWLGPDTTPRGIRKAAAGGLIEFTRYPPTPRGRIYLTAANIRANQAAGLCLANPGAKSPPKPAGRRRASNVSDFRPAGLTARLEGARRGRRATAS